MAKMRAAIFVEPGRVVLDEKPVPDVGVLDALVRVTTTTICGTDVHILKGEYPVARGLTIGHEPVGVIEKLGSELVKYSGAPERAFQKVPIEAQSTAVARATASICNDERGRLGRTSG
ncbi:MAG: alcohol dehydrogenase catalytic domain-containing protein, partial [Rubrivivax sp.]